MKSLFRYMASLCLYSITMPLQAQYTQNRAENPYAELTRQEVTNLKKQAVDIFSAVQPTLSEASKSTVAVYFGSDRIAFGTVVTTSYDGSQQAILTKLSEIALSRAKLSIVTPDKKEYRTRIIGAYPEHDLALLSLPNNKPSLPSIDFSKQIKPPKLGDFISLVRQDGQAEGFGVVSVKKRSLLIKNRGFLGVQISPQELNEGVLLDRIESNSAAEKANLQANDILISINGQKISGYKETTHLLQSLPAGSEIKIDYKRGGELKTATATLGSRQDKPTGISQRMDTMEKMGANLNYIRTNFPQIIQTDMAIERNDTGATVVNLDGKPLGLCIARASRIKTYIIPSSVIATTLSEKPIDINDLIKERR